MCILSNSVRQKHTPKIHVCRIFIGCRFKIQVNSEVRVGNEQHFSLADAHTGDNWKILAVYLMSDISVAVCKQLYGPGCIKLN